MFNIRIYFSFIFRYFIQLFWFICRPSDSTVSEDAGIEPRTVATFALAVRRSNQAARSHPLLGQISFKNVHAWVGLSFYFGRYISSFITSFAPLLMFFSLTISLLLFFCCRRGGDGYGFAEPFNIYPSLEVTELYLLRPHSILWLKEKTQEGIYCNIIFNED